MAREKKVSARDKILKFLLEQFPNKVNTKRLQKVAGISDYQRRIRELRAAGWRVHSHLDDQSLVPGEYRLASKQRTEGYEFAKVVDARTRALVLQRNGYTCQACGRGLDDEDPTSPGRTIRLHLDHIDPNGGSSPDNLRVLCSACNQGKQDLILQQTAINLLSAIRRASRKDQLAVYEWLKKHFQQ